MNNEDIMSKAITEKREDAAQPPRWPTQLEVPPSLMQDAAPQISRWVGAFGLALLVLGGVSLGMQQIWGRTTIIGPVWGLFFTVLGLLGLLFHAANDSEPQIRRAYMALGLLWLALGVGLTVLPYQAAGMASARAGALFLPYGFVCLVLGLLFTMAFLRNETEAKPRDIAVYALGGLGAVMAVVGFLFGNIYPAQFLLPYGALLILLGLAFLWAFIAYRGGTNEDQGYWAALGVGALGLVFFLIALGRSGLPALLEKLHWIQPGAPRFLSPFGLLLMAGGLLYLALAAGLTSDRQYVVLVRRELASMFLSPMIYLVLLGFAALGWFMYFEFLNNLVRVNVETGAATPVSVAEPIVRGYILNIFPIISVLMLVPVVTMRLFSEEHRTGTMEMMFTAPVEEWVVVLAKFTAALIFFLLSWLPWALFLVDLRAEGGATFDYLPLLGFGVALLINGAGFVSMGLFFSSLTRNQLTAAVLTFVGMFFLLAVILAPSIPFVPAWLATSLAYLSFYEKWNSAVQGKLATRDLVLYLSMTVFWLFLTVKVLESRKWR
jgi:ABC-2 type transport system permease protein